MSTTAYDISVRNLTRETPDCLSLELDIPVDLRDTFAYTAGQYLTLEFAGRKGPLRRAYSLCSAPHEGTWRIAVKRQPRGEVSGRIHRDLRPGDPLRVIPPLGRFTVQPDADRRRGYFFVAAGSGITPVMAMIKALLEEEPQSFCYLLYGSRDQDHIIFREALDALAGRYAGQLRVTHVLSRPKKPGLLGRITGQKAPEWDGPTGRIDAAILERFRQDMICPYREQFWYLCGPAPLMDACDDFLRKAQVPAERIFREHFDSEPLPDSGMGMAAHLHADLHGRTLEVDVSAGQTLLAALLAAEHDAPYSCSSGACASCMARVLEGEVLMPHAPALEREEIAAGFILTCQAKAASEHLHIAYGK